MITIDGKDSGYKLLDVLHLIKGYNYYALALHLSRLSSKYRSRYQIKIVVNIINNRFGEADGCVFLLQDSDVVVIFGGEEQSYITKVVREVRHLFIDDPAAEEGNNSLFALYDLNLQWNDFFLFCNRKLHSPAPALIQPSNDLGLDFTKLARLCEEIQTVELADHIAINTVSILTERVGDNKIPLQNHKLRPLFSTIHLKINSFFGKLGVNLNNNLVDNHLIKYLIGEADKVLINSLVDNAKSPLNGATCIKLCLETLFTKEFNKLCNYFNKQSIQLLVEIDISDSLRNINAFIKARESLAEHNCLLVLGGISQDVLNNFGIALSADLFKLTLQNDRSLKRVKRAIQMWGLNRTIMAHGEKYDNQMVELAVELGIALFEGDYANRRFRVN